MRGILPLALLALAIGGAMPGAAFDVAQARAFDGAQAEIRF